MHPPRFARCSSAMIGALLLCAGCARGAPADKADSASTPPVATAPAALPAPRAQMGMMMGDSAMIMLDGFCGADAGDPTMGARVDLIVNGDAALHASHVMINVTSAPAGDFKAELVAGKNAHAMCGGRARRIYIGGTTMFIGNPTLTLSSAGPVTVAARSTVGAMLGVPIEVKPGQKGAILNWETAPADAKP
ncbi:MAG TPA: hypothetical protein VK617_13510 [Gemmatimonadaceae bacterium]|nr:hypothetical protein [Gemmatimonadaceae bacterium]